MTMEVTEQEEVSFLVNLLDKLFRIENGRVGLLGWLAPLSVKVDPGEVDPIVPDHNAIDIEHGYDENQEIVPKLFRKKTRPC